MCGLHARKVACLAVSSAVFHCLHMMIDRLPQCLWCHHIVNLEGLELGEFPNLAEPPYQSVMVLNLFLNVVQGSTSQVSHLQLAFFANSIPNPLSGWQRFSHMRLDPRPASCSSTTGCGGGRPLFVLLVGCH